MLPHEFGSLLVVEQGPVRAPLVLLGRGLQGKVKLSPVVVIVVLLQLALPVVVRVQQREVGVRVGVRVSSVRVRVAVDRGHADQRGRRLELLQLVAVVVALADGLTELEQKKLNSFQALLSICDLCRTSINEVKAALVE